MAKTDVPIICLLSRAFCRRPVFSILVGYFRLFVVLGAVLDSETSQAVYMVPTLCQSAVFLKSRIGPGPGEFSLAAIQGTRPKNVPPSPQGASPLYFCDVPEPTTAPGIGGNLEIRPGYGKLCFCNFGKFQKKCVWGCSKVWDIAR